MNIHKGKSLKRNLLGCLSTAATILLFLRLIMKHISSEEINHIGTDKQNISA